jgi:hypothetical protein
LVASGYRIGAMIKRIDDGSITLPAASSRMLTTSRNTQRLKFLSMIQAAIACGICSCVIRNENSTALVMM